VSSKKKKQAKLKRVMQTVKKHDRKAGMHPAEAFAAMQLLHDPQVLGRCDERLFSILLHTLAAMNALRLHHVSGQTQDPTIGQPACCLHTCHRS